MVVGLDARGFLYAPIMAAELGVPFVPVSLRFHKLSDISCGTLINDSTVLCIQIRKKGKLPGACAEASFDLEYGSATFAIQKEAAVAEGKRVLIVDDLLATGGTLKVVINHLFDLYLFDLVNAFLLHFLHFSGRL